MKKRQFYLILSILLTISLLLTTLLAYNFLPRRTPVSDNRSNGTGSTLSNTEIEKNGYDVATGSETLSTSGEQGDTDDTGSKEGNGAKGSKTGESDAKGNETLEESGTQEGIETWEESETQRESEIQKEDGKQGNGESIPKEEEEETHNGDQHPKEQQPAETVTEEELRDREPQNEEANEITGNNEQEDNQLPQEDNSLEKDDAGAGEKEPGEGTKDGSKTGESHSYSTAVPVLESFYEYVNNREFEKAYNLIDETIRFNILKKILSQVFQGIEINTELNKSDIDVSFFEAMIETSGIFKNVEIDEIEKEENDGSTSKIFYYHAIIMDETSAPLIMPVIATLRNTPDGWKISAFDDG